MQVPTTDIPPDGDQLLYTPQEAAKIVRMSKHWLVTQANKEEIPHHRLGRYYRFSREDLIAIKDMYAKPARRSRQST
ncbi:helix-turn-helix domain-containing protein [Streptosporangium longisporum]|uniref:Helix-turn-helix domain-containing protein n=1 Tax=Streptosporangium longisporum TaxID=46187 RepID=A0ABP6L2G4_9ACTN